MKKTNAMLGVLRTAVLTILISLAFMRTVSADESDDSMDVTVPVTYGQTEARQMLDLINEFRTSGDAWYWNSDGSKTTGVKADALIYDYGLEQAAMQRAAEIGIMFGHIRPNGESYSKISPNYMRGENLAGGYYSAERAFIGLREDDYDYSGQGHRRSMLNGYFRYIGIGHATVDGVQYWVQEFGINATGTAWTQAEDSERDVTVTVTKSDILETGYHMPDDFDVNCLQDYELWEREEPYGYFIYDGSFPGGKKIRISNSVTSLTSSDEKIFTVDQPAESGVTVHAKYPGTAQIVAQIKDVYGISSRQTAEVEVCPLTIGTAEFTGPSEYTYTGKAVTPGIKVTYVYNELVKGTDYTLSYYNNVSSGIAYAVIDGIGRYTGEVQLYFRINPADASGASVTVTKNPVYDGSEKTAEVTVKYNGKTLKKDVDYTVSGEGYDAGEYDGTVTFEGNYTGSTQFKFRILPADASSASVSAPDLTYDGSELTPDVTVQWKNMMLAEGTDYTVAYNKTVCNPGTYTGTVKFKGNFKGSKTFTVKVKNPYSYPIGDGYMYRLYNPNSGEHFYTANVREMQYLDSIGWNYEGIGWTAPVTSDTPVYRLYNPNAGDHHYTMNPDEKDMLVHLGWNYEGIGWYSDDAEGVPLYRQYNPNAIAGSHNYTTSKAENDYLASIGWRAEGIGWYGTK